jgi:hypothetical protein
MTVVQLAGAPDLLQVNEHGEFKYASMSDGKETYGLLSYGRIVSLTARRWSTTTCAASTGWSPRSAILPPAGEPHGVLAAHGQREHGRRHRAVPCGHHGNLVSGAPSALQFSSLTTMRAAMRMQKGLQNEELNLAPAYLIVPAALEQTAYQLTSSNYVPAKQADVNEFRKGGRTALEPVVEPVLDANSTDGLVRDGHNGQVDTVEYCYLDGADGPVIESQIGFEVDGMQLKCRHDFAAKAIDYRGMYKSAGA